MDAQDFRSLQEAYMEVVANEAYKPFPKGKVDKKMASKAVSAVKHQVAATWGDKNKSSENQEKANKLGFQAKKMAQISTEKNKEANAWSRGVKSKHRSEVRRKIRYMDDNARDQRERGYGSTTKKEEVDIYDIILSHLLDEGYAETPEAAEVMMVNMSEEWRESILNEGILDYQSFKDKRKRVKKKVKELEAQKSKDPKDLGFRNARLQRRVDSMNKVLSKKNKEIKSSSQEKSYNAMAKGGFKHHDNPQSRYYIGDKD